MGTHLEDYADAFRNIGFERRDGILHMRLHTSGGPLLWSQSVHEELPTAFYMVGADRGNHVVILSGTGDVFCTDIDYASNGNMQDPVVMDNIFREGKQILGRLLDIDVPVVGVVNGPARLHAEIPLLSDVVLASATAVFQDAAHFERGVVPGDGVHTLWQRWLGPNRGRYFLLMGQEISAGEALSLGLVGEVVEHESVMDRAWAVAERLADRPEFTRRYSRQVLTMSLRREVNWEISEGLALESLARQVLKPGSYPPIS